MLIGEQCHDVYVYGTCDRLSPEAPIPIFKPSREEYFLGMAQNVKSNLESFGITVEFITDWLKDIVKTRYIDERYNHQFLRVDEDPIVLPFGRGSLYDPNYDVNSYDAVVISDYDKGFLSKEKIFEIVSSSNVPVFIDSKKTELPNSNCFLKINEAESKLLKGEYNNTIVTKGPGGAEYNGKTYQGFKSDMCDVCGAGDTFLSALVYFYLKCGTIEKAIPYANKAASIAVSNPGTYCLNTKDIEVINGI